MSAASLLKVYDGLDPELAFQTAGPGGSQNLAQVLAVGASANDLAITDINSLSGGTTVSLAINSGVGHPLALTGDTNASLTAIAGNVTVEATAGVLALSSPNLNGELNIVLNANKLSVAPLNAAAPGPTYTGAVRQLKIQVSGVDFFIALNPAAFA